MNEKVDPSAIGNTFKDIIAHMKSGFPVWENFIWRGYKLQKQLEQTILSFSSFVEELYKVSELATNKMGATFEIGTGLTNIAMWHRGQELKLKDLSQTLVKKLLNPLQIKVDEWRKTTTALEKEHEKVTGKTIKEVKEAKRLLTKATKKSLESKQKKDKLLDKSSPIRFQVEHYQQETERLLKEAEEKEKKNLNHALLEERSWFCGFVKAFTCVLDVEVGMLENAQRLNSILKDLHNEVDQPAQLPDSTREMLENWTLSSSPMTGHRTAICSAHSMVSVSSIGSGDSVGLNSSLDLRTIPSQQHTSATSAGYKSPTAPPSPPPPPPVGISFTQFSHSDVPQRITTVMPPTYPPAATPKLSPAQHYSQPQTQNFYMSLPRKPVDTNEKQQFMGSTDSFSNEESVGNIFSMLPMENITGSEQADDYLCSISSPNVQPNGDAFSSHSSQESLSLHEQLAATLRQRSVKQYELPPLTPSQPLPSTQSVPGRLTTAPPVHSKPYRPKATKSGGTIRRPFSQIVEHTSIATPQHIPARSTSLDLDSEDDDNVFARVLRERKLKSVQTHDRSKPYI